jgi:hypothetical protein
MPSAKSFAACLLANVNWQKHKPFDFTPTLDGLSTGQTNPLAVMFYDTTIIKKVITLWKCFLEIEPFLNFKFKSVYGVVSWFDMADLWIQPIILGFFIMMQ